MMAPALVRVNEGVFGPDYLPGSKIEAFIRVDPVLRLSHEGHACDDTRHMNQAARPANVTFQPSS